LNFAAATDAIRNRSNDAGAVAEGQALLSSKTVVAASAGSSRVSPGTAVSLPQISIGQSITGTLSAGDSLYPDTTYFKMYQFTTTPGREMTIDLSSNDFDPVLIIRGEGLAQSIVNDDGGPGCASRVSQAFLSNGPYRILVNTTASPVRQTGRFTLSLSDGSKPVQDRSENDCTTGTRTVTTGTQNLPVIGVGETINGALTSSDSLYPDNSYFRFYQFTAPAGRPITIDLESDDFDSYLFLRGPGISGGRDFQDDDSGGNCHARLTATFPQTGEYEVVVNSQEHYATGAFTLSVTSGSKPKSVQRCSRSRQ